MSGLAISGNSSVQALQTEKQPVQNKPDVQITDKAVEISRDQVATSGIKRGIVPTLKASGIGLVAGGVGTFAAISAAALIKGGGQGGEMMMGAIGGAGMGGIASAITAGVVTNITDNKLKGALIGAGGLTGVALLLRGSEFIHDPKAALGAIACTTIIGGLSGLLGASLARPKD